MKAGHLTAKCVACGDIFLMRELSEDNRCRKCVKENRKPKRKLKKIKNRSDS